MDHTSKFIRHYYDEERRGYIKESQHVHRGEKIKVEVFFPAPKELTFKEVEQLFIGQLRKELLPWLAREFITRHLQDKGDVLFEQSDKTNN